MSLSDEKRLKNILLALATITALLNRNKQTLRQFSFQRTDPVFGRIFPTTWGELEDLNFVKPKNPLAGTYRFTSNGWATGLNFLKEFDGFGIKEDLGKLSSALKRRIKATNRTRHALVKVSDVETETGLEHAFIINSIDAMLMERLLDTHGAKWVAGKEETLIMIPTNIGLKRLFLK